MQQHLPSLRATPLLLARGGASEHVRSSVMEACAVALRLGSHGLDLDIAQVAGGVRIAQRIRGGIAKKLLRADPVNPTVGEFFAAVPGALKVPVFVRVRGEDVAEVTAAFTVGDAFPMLGFVVQSSRGALQQAPSAEPSSSVTCYACSALAEMSHGPERFFAAARAGGWRGVVLPDSDWTGGVVTLAHRFELEAIADGVVQQHRAVALLRMGIDAMSSVWPDRLASAALEFERTGPTEA